VAPAAVNAPVKRACEFKVRGGLQLVRGTHNMVRFVAAYGLNVIEQFVEVGRSIKGRRVTVDIMRLSLRALKRKLASLSLLRKRRPRGAPTVDEVRSRCQQPRKKAFSKGKIKNLSIRSKERMSCHSRKKRTSLQSRRVVSTLGQGQASSKSGSGSKAGSDNECLDHCEFVCCSSDDFIERKEGKGKSSGLKWIKSRNEL
jgi:hypothetical protein